MFRSHQVFLILAVFFCFLQTQLLLSQGVQSKASLSSVSEIEQLWSKAQAGAAVGDQRRAIRFGVRAFDLSLKNSDQKRQYAANFASEICDWYLFENNAKSAIQYARKSHAIAIEFKNDMRQSKWHLDWVERIVASKPEQFRALMDVQRRFDKAEREGASANIRFAIAAEFVPLEEEILGELHPYYANSLYGIALAAIECGEFDVAATNIEQALAIYNLVYGPRDSLTIAAAFILS